MHFKVRVEGKISRKAFYTVLAVTPEGRKDILGLYLSENEGARFWLGVLNDLKARGFEDILIASIDGLKGFPEAIAEVFPKTEIQLCVVHQIRNSLLPEPDLRKPYPLSWDEQHKLFQQLPAHLKSMALFAVNTGCRDSEICELRWDWEIQIPELPHIIVFIVPGELVKNGEERLIVCNEPLCIAICYF